MSRRLGTGLAMAVLVAALLAPSSALARPWRDDVEHAGRVIEAAGQFDFAAALRSLLTSLTAWWEKEGGTISPGG